MRRLAVLFCLLATSAFAQSAFKPEEAAAHAGGTVTIEGIANVTTAKAARSSSTWAAAARTVPFPA
jgi:hypothetical protein